MKSYLMDNDTAIAIEKLAREQAFMKFLENILFSLTVWQNDVNVQNTLPPVTTWLRECVVRLNEVCEYNNVNNR